MSSRAEAAAHEDSYELEEAEVVGAVGTRIDHPSGLVLSGLVSVVRGGDEET
jgi:hypothetical protein